MLTPGAERVSQPTTERQTRTPDFNAEDRARAHRVLIAGGESELSALVAYHLAKAGYRVSTAATGPDTLETGREERPTLIVLDTSLKGISAYDVLAELRAQDDTRDVGILLLTNQPREADRIRALTLGADDCMAKPFAPDELVLRVRAILRRVAAPAVGGGGRISVGPVTLDTAAHRVLVEGREVKLTATEFDLLRTLMQREGRVQTRAQLLESVWGRTANVATRTVDMHMQRVRRKLGSASGCIDTVRGAGYRFQHQAAAPPRTKPAGRR